MAENLFKQAGASEYPQLLADSSGHIKENIVLLPGSGTVKRGTVLARDASGFYKPAASADIAPTAMMAIADEAADASDAANTVGIPIAAYVKGIFLARHVVLANGAPLTLANMSVLSNAGLMIRQSVSQTGEHPVFDADKA
jgi:hypothetical protein